MKWYNSILSILRGVFSLSEEATDAEIHQIMQEKTLVVAENVPPTLKAETPDHTADISAMQTQIAALATQVQGLEARLKVVEKMPAAVETTGVTVPVSAVPEPKKAYETNALTLEAQRLFGGAKKVLVAIAFFLIAFSAQGQRFLDINVPADTLVNQVSRSFTTAPTFLDAIYTYSIHVVADSISGANGGSAILEVSNDRTGSRWYPVQTLVIDGTGTDQALWEGTLYARRIRIRFDMPSGTRRVVGRVHGVFKRNN